jgi:crotonobetainyl-CoA:carnitine CoA-transferase CaiB-like acyl-CoA transferase
VAKHTAEELQALADEHKQAGTICWTKEEFKASEHGKANAEAGLFEIEAVANPNQKPGWWTPDPRTSAARPLAGLKVVDLTRVIAGPTITRSLAELGASVMRITAPHLPDMSMLHPDLNHGKWNACLDLRDEADRHKLRDLVLGADVFVQGYRPGVLDKYGFGEDDVIRMCEARGRGIVYCAENCYG